jgi:hypothetical protein
MNKRYLYGWLALFLSALACEPIFAIGWNELFLLILLIAFLFGPPLYRFIRRLEEFLKREKKDK